MKLIEVRYSNDTGELFVYARNAEGEQTLQYITVPDASERNIIVDNAIEYALTVAGVTE